MLVARRRSYRTAAERRGIWAVWHRWLLPWVVGSSTLPMLTYIFIGFLGNRIYAEENFGVDHNMLLIGGALAHRKSRYLRVGHDVLRTLAVRSHSRHKALP